MGGCAFQRLGTIRVAPQRPLPSLLGLSAPPTTDLSPTRPLAGPPRRRPALAILLGGKAPGGPACGRPRDQASCGHTHKRNF